MPSLAASMDTGVFIILFHRALSMRDILFITSSYNNQDDVQKRDELDGSADTYNL